MTDKEKILMFEKYMREKGVDESIIKYDIKVVKILCSDVLRYFNESLESIDTYTFEEFTDMVGVIDGEFGGRDGIPRIMEAMQLLTEFLKENKLIKGGKIAHYKRMFSDVKYYLEKYDMMTGKKDDSKEFIKTVTTNRFSSRVIKLVEDVNVYDFKTLDLIDKILNDVPLEKNDYQDEVTILISILADIGLLEIKNGALEATKKGRCISRLSAEDRYGAILYLFYYNVHWDSIFNIHFNNEESLNFKDILYILSSIFRKNKECIVNVSNSSEKISEEKIVEVASDEFRIARIESSSYGRKLMNICFAGTGLLEISNLSDKEIQYKASDFGQEIFKAVFEESTFLMRDKITSISYMIKNKDYDLAERNILSYLTVFGGNTIIWDYFGQLLLLKKSYNFAYEVLKHGYENSSKRGKASKSLLYHLVLCCRKLKYNNDIESYENKLQSMERA